MAIDPVSVGVAGVIASVVWSVFSGVTDFAPGVCDRLEPYLLSQVVGQELAIHQLCDAVCDHVQQAHPIKPLVLSVHGPPGVGKSLVHQLAAKALYNKDPASAVSCPGVDCPGYRVLYGLDYVLAERSQQHTQVRDALLDLLRSAPQALIVVEEYDKLDCDTRGMLRQLLENARSHEVAMSRAVVVLESNTGYTQLHDMLVQAGDRSKIQPEAAQRVLKDLVFDLWQRDGCEERTDTLKMVGLIDFFLPFLPLESPHIRRLFGMRLAERAQQLEQGQGLRLVWDDSVLDFLVSKVDFEGRYPIEGAKEVSTIMTRYVSRALRTHGLQQPSPQPRSPSKHAAVSAASAWLHTAKDAAKKVAKQAIKTSSSDRPNLQRIQLVVSSRQDALLVETAPS